MTTQSVWSKTVAHNEVDGEMEGAAATSRLGSVSQIMLYNCMNMIGCYKSATSVTASSKSVICKACKKLIRFRIRIRFIGQVCEHIRNLTQVLLQCTV